MIKKQNLWFLTLFSLILVLGVYYITMPNEILSNNKNNSEETTKEVNSEKEESNVLNALQVQLEDERQEEKAKLQTTLNNSAATSEEKNNAYLALRSLNEIQGIEEEIEKKIKTNYSLDSFVKITKDEVSVVILKKDHDIALANKIMRSIQEEFTDQKSISIKFQI